MYRIEAWTLVVALGAVGAGGPLLAAQPTPSYYGIEESVAAIRSSWESPQGDDVRRAEGWNAFGTAVEQALQGYATAGDDAARQDALARLSTLAATLQGSSWPPAVRLRGEIEEWLRPRQNLAQASQALSTALEALPPASSPEAEANRQRWLDLDDRLATAFRDFETTESPVARADATNELREALDTIRDAAQQQGWAPAFTLHSALAGMFDRPNLEAVADVAAVAPYLNQQVVQPEVLYYKGQTSYITPGPKTGFALIPNDNGITFFNSQIAYSVTPVSGFQQQVAQDDRGRFITRLYELSATVYNTSEAQAYVTVQPRPGGIDINTQTTNNIDAAIDSVKKVGHHPHITRTAISVVGFDQERIEREIYEAGIGRIRQEAAQSAREVADYKQAQAEAEVNAQAARYLVGPNTIASDVFALNGVELRSQPSFVGVRGTIQYLGATGQPGAEFSPPAEFGLPGPGVTADVHLSSALTNLARGFVQSPRVQEVENLLIEFRPDAERQDPPVEGLQWKENASFDDLMAAVDRFRQLADPNYLVVRVRRPGRSPVFMADRDGNLVGVLYDMVLEVPTPAATARGGLAGPAADVYRIEMPAAVVTLSFRVQAPAPGMPLQLTGQIAQFDPGQNAAVYAVTAANEEGQRLNAFTAALVLGVLRNRLAGQDIEYDLGDLNLTGFAIQSVSPLHPTGWMRAVLTSTR